MKNYPAIHRQSDPELVRLRAEKARERKHRLWLNGLKKSDPQAYKRALDHERALLSRAARLKIPGAHARKMRERLRHDLINGSTKPHLER